MIKTGTLPIRGVRTNPLKLTITFKGLDLTGADLQGYVLQNWDNSPSSPQVSLPDGVAAGVTGISLGVVSTVDGVVQSPVTLFISEADMGDIIAAAEVGSDLNWVWYLDVTPAGGTKQRYLEGPFIVGGSNTGRGNFGGATATVVEQEVAVAIDGTGLLQEILADGASLAAQSEASAAAAQTAAALSYSRKSYRPPLVGDIYRNAILERFTVDGSVSAKHGGMTAHYASVENVFNRYMFDTYGYPNVLRINGSSSNGAGATEPRGGFTLTPEDLAKIGVVPSDASPPTISVRGMMLAQNQDNQLQSVGSSGQMWIMLRYNGVGASLSPSQVSATDVRFLNADTGAFDGPGSAASDPLWDDNTATQTLELGVRKLFMRPAIKIPATYNGKALTGIIVLFLGKTVGAGASKLDVMADVVSGPLVDEDATYMNLPLDQVEDSGEDGVTTRVGPSLLLNSDGTGQIQASNDGTEVLRGVEPYPAVTIANANIFNFAPDIIGGAGLRSNSDDVAPNHVLGTTLGENHSWVMGLMEVPGHGRTQSNVRELVALGGNQYIVVGVADADHLYLTQRNGNSLPPTGTYSHVSGGTATTSFTATDSTLAYLFPHANREIATFLDDTRLTASSGLFSYRATATFRESYDVLPKATIEDWYIAGNGADGSIEPSGAPAFSVSNTYEFDQDGNAVIYSDFLARSTMALADLMGAQAQQMGSTDGTVNYYIPNSLPGTKDGSPYDFSMIDSSDTSGWSSSLDITPANSEPAPALLPDRLVMLSDNYGFAVGFVAVGDAAPDVRRTNCSARALQVRNGTSKVYMRWIDKGGETLNDGDYFNCVTYRAWFKRTAERTCLYAVRTRSADYLFIDWHDTAFTDRVPIPADFMGRSFTVEDSRNAMLKSDALAGSLVVNVDAAGDYAFLRLKVAKS